MTVNPKEIAAVGKWRPSLVPQAALAVAAAALQSGADKYGAYNWRGVTVHASTYMDSTLRHLVAWWEGEDDDPDSGLPHLAHAIAGLLVLVDAALAGRLVDDRPPPLPAGWREQLEALAQRLAEAGPAPAGRRA